MPDYIYLLEKRLSRSQQNALRQICQAARDAGMTVFLVGGAVRDLTSGSPVHDLDITVQGNALKLKRPLEKAGGVLWGEHEPSRTLFFRFPVGVRVEISSARREEYPKPGKPVYHWDSILEDLRRRDFTANAMALSLNERSYGLLMDPLNGVADIEARLLRLVSSYGFIEAPERLLRATRLASRLSWELEERTKIRFQNAKEEGAISLLSNYQRGYELEEIGHEEDPFTVLTAMEAQGWMQSLDPAWTTAKVDTIGLEEMRRILTRLQVQGVNPDPAAAAMHFLTAKLRPAELAALKSSFVRPGFVKEWDELDSLAREFGKQLSGKAAATPSATWKLFTSADPQAVLWLGLTSKSATIQAKYESFFTTWPEARQKVPHALMQELRITQEIPGYEEMLNQLFFAIIDGKLEGEEQLRAFLEPYSPPAPPPPVTIRRGRGSKKTGETKAKLADDEDDLDEEDADHDHDHDHDDEVLELGGLNHNALDHDTPDHDAPEQDEREHDEFAEPSSAAAEGKPPAPAKRSASAARKTPEAGEKLAKLKSGVTAAADQAKTTHKTPIVAKAIPAKAIPAKHVLAAKPQKPAGKLDHAHPIAKAQAVKTVPSKAPIAKASIPKAAVSAAQGKSAVRSAVRSIDKPSSHPAAAAKKSKPGKLTSKLAKPAEKQLHGKPAPSKKSSTLSKAAPGKKHK